MRNRNLYAIKLVILVLLFCLFPLVAFADDGEGFSISKLMIFAAPVLVIVGAIGAILVKSGNDNAAKVGQVMSEIASDLKDRLDPDTNGGTGRGPDNPA